MTQSNKPVDTIRDAHLKASIWKNTSERGDYYTTTFARSYKDSQGNYKDTQNFSKHDLLRVSELARGAYGRVNELQQERGHSKAQEPEYKRDDKQEFREKRQAQTNAPARQAPTRDY